MSLIFQSLYRSLYIKIVIYVIGKLLLQLTYEIDIYGIVIFQCMYACVITYCYFQLFLGYQCYCYTCEVYTIKVVSVIPGKLLSTFRPIDLHLKLDSVQSKLLYFYQYVYVLLTLSTNI